MNYYTLLYIYIYTFHVVETHWYQFDIPLRLAEYLGMLSQMLGHRG